MSLESFLSTFKIGLEIEFDYKKSKIDKMEKYVKETFGKFLRSHSETGRVWEISLPPIRLFEIDRKDFEYKYFKLLKVALKGIELGSSCPKQAAYFPGVETLSGSMHMHLSSPIFNIDNYLAPALLLLTIPLMSRTGYNFRNTHLSRVNSYLPIDDKIAWLNIRDEYDTYEFRINEYLPITGMLIPTIAYFLNVLRSENKDILPAFRQIYLDLITTDRARYVKYPSVFLFRYRKMARENPEFKQLILETVDISLDMLLDTLKKRKNKVNKLVDIFQFVKDNLEDLYFPNDYFRIVRSIRFREYKWDLPVLARRICEYTKNGIAQKLRNQIHNMILDS